jgi:hypothetical protein
MIFRLIKQNYQRDIQIINTEQNSTNLKILKNFGNSEN